MSWTWVRPRDPSALSGRPLLDLGVGDAMTTGALAGGAGLVVGVDASGDALRAARRTGRLVLVRAFAERLPFIDATFATVLAADLFHHLADDDLGRVLDETARVLRPGGRLVAWWYAEPRRPGPGAPSRPRGYGDVADAVMRGGFLETKPLELELSVQPSPPTVGLVAVR